MGSYVIACPKDDLAELDREIERRLVPLINATFPGEWRKRLQTMRNGAAGTRAKRGRIALEGMIGYEEQVLVQATGSVRADVRATIEDGVRRVAARTDNPDAAELVSMLDRRDMLRDQVNEAAIPEPGAMRLVGYCRVSTTEQGSSGLGLDAQEQAIRDAVDRRGDVLVSVIHEVASGGKSDREGLDHALAMCGAEADGLIVAKLDRATRSLSHFATIMNRSKKEGWAFVALDLGVDTSTPAGELVANVMASVAQWERSVISERTRSALQVASARGELARPDRRTDRSIVNQIVSLRHGGATLRQIVDVLNAEGARTAQGGLWRPGTVAYLLKKEEGA